MIPALQGAVVNVSVGHAGMSSGRMLALGATFLIFPSGKGQRICYLIVNTRDVNYTCIDVVIASTEV